jgi:nucleotide-binding universal stress UspA family protein
MLSAHLLSVGLPECVCVCACVQLKYKVRGETSKNTGEGILKIADEELADVIVVGARGGSGASRTLLGSVSEYITRNATIPVMIVPIRPITARRRNSMVAHGLDPQ